MSSLQRRQVLSDARESLTIRVCHEGLIGHHLGSMILLVWAAEVTRR